MSLKAPFPYFGGKATVTSLVWQRIGTVRNYVEPFFGSGAVLLGRPDPIDGAETVNDLDGMLANFWRALQHNPGAVADYADWPVNEVDLYARHQWLIAHKPSIIRRLRDDPEWFDVKSAGWWVWGISQWIGNGWCDASNEAEERLPSLDRGGRGTHRRRPYLGGGGQGVNATDLAGRHVHLGRPYNVHAEGVHRAGGRSRPHLWGQGMGIHDTKHRDSLHDYFAALAQRLRHVRVCSGDWSRVCGPTPTHFHGTTGVFLDPPYNADRNKKLYNEDADGVSQRVTRWCLEMGQRDDMRIVLAGYEGEHDLPDWDCVPWAAMGGYGRRTKGKGWENRLLERLWCSPACVEPAPTLF